MKTEQQQYNVTCCYLCSTADKHRKNKCGIMNLIYFIVYIFYLFFVLCLCVCMSSWCTLSVLCVLFVPCRVSTKGSDRFFLSCVGAHSARDGCHHFSSTPNVCLFSHSGCINKHSPIPFSGI